MLPRRARQSFSSAVSEPPAPTKIGTDTWYHSSHQPVPGFQNDECYRPTPAAGSRRSAHQSRCREEHRTLPIGRIAGWIVALIILAVIAWAVYTQFIVPRRAPVVETIVVMPFVMIRNSP